jgi:hypothetical protein
MPKNINEIAQYVHEFGVVWEMDRSKMPNGYLEDA